MPHVPINTYGRRHDEVRKWKDHAWYEVLYKLESSLSTIDRDYEIIQIKEKFGSLRFYIWSDSPYRDKMNDLVRQAEKNIETLERQRRRFDRIAVPPSPSSEGYKW